MGARSRTLRWATYLAPSMFDLYAFVAGRVQDHMGIALQLVQGSDYGELADGGFDFAFVCGLPFVRLANHLQAIAAPVLRGERFAGRPIYFSDVIVRRESAHRRFRELRGCAWAFNERLSQSGYGIVRHHLLQLGETNGFFGSLKVSRWHRRSIDMVCAGDVDAAAIDCHVLAYEMERRPELRQVVRVIDSLGPSPSQPLVALRGTSADVVAGVRAALSCLDQDDPARRRLREFFVERFVAVSDSHYDSIRRMEAAAAAHRFRHI